jgi:hypothetical protein
MNKKLLAEEFKRGQTDGLVGTAIVMTKIINGTDKGNGVLANKELEKIRRVFLSWRDVMIENMDKNNAVSKRLTETLINTKKIMDS